jgi:hypothetical protein
MIEGVRECVDCYNSGKKEEYLLKNNVEEKRL